MGITFRTQVTCGIKGEILVDNFAGGNGNYVWSYLGKTDVDTYRQVLNQSADRIQINGISHSFVGLDDGSYFVGVCDTEGNVGVSQIIQVSCANLTEEPKIPKKRKTPKLTPVPIEKSKNGFSELIFKILNIFSKKK